jgi:hypothetical protein
MNELDAAIYVLGWDGVSYLSKVIQTFEFCQAKSHISHCPQRPVEGVVEYSAELDGLFKGGTYRKQLLGVGHVNGTEANVYRWAMTRGEYLACVDQSEEWAEDKVPYDLRGVLGFASRKDWGEGPQSLFCSESVMWLSSLYVATNPILCDVDPWKVGPNEMCHSPVLARNRIGRIKVLDGKAGKWMWIDQVREKAA